jgi:hypothetical protein
VGPDCAFGDPEPAAGLSVGVAVGDNAEHIQVPAGEPRDAIAASFG